LNKHSAIDGRLNLAYDELELSSSATSTSGSFERENRFAGTFVETTLPKQVETLNCGIPEDMQQSSSSSVDEQLLIVEQETTDKDRRYTREKTYLLSALKCLLSIFMSMALFVCVVAGKISLVHIGQQLNYTATKDNFTYIVNDNSASLRETSFIMLIIIMIFPSLYSLLRAICVSGMKSSHPWPTQRAIIWGLIGSFFESAGLSLYVIGTLSVISEANITIVLMNALFIVPVFWQMGKACVERVATTDDPSMKRLLKKTRRKSITNMFLSFFAILLQLGGLFGIVYMTSNRAILDIKFILVPTSILLISFGWCPKLKKLQIDHDLALHIDEQRHEQTSPQSHENGTLDTNLSEMTMTSQLGSTDSILEPKKKGKELKNDTQKVFLESNTARGKATIINSSFKILFIPFFCAAVAHFMKVVNLKQLRFGFESFFQDQTLTWMFFTQIISSFIGYHLAWLACTMTMQRLCFALPLTLSTPAAVILIVANRCEHSYLSFLKCSQDSSIWLYIALISVALWLGQFFATTYYAWKNQDFIMANEAVLFWTPSYEGVMLEQNLLLNRKNEATNEYFVNYRSLVKDSRLYICTTMYHEESYEMEQLLNSLGGIDCARKEAGRKFESHIFFDDGVRDKTLKKYALQLVSLVERTLDIKPSFAKKIMTPYGMKLQWKLPGGMDFHIHLKDNYKVKNKKRWSQVMYMSYVIDFREKGNCDHAYILTTDADVKFRPYDVMALMDLMSRDPSVGAVCGRTHPMGSGPLVWYQIFDYAIGHWLLKVAEHVLGSVLCSPGCFSVYRANAIRDVLPTYATHVECALDFLTKDMGEDRWLCTLMIEHGWKLQFCAAAANSTYCPDSFEEFFKQRRRWTPSTLANQIVLIQKAEQMRKANDVITVGYIFYQLLLMISTIVGPSNVILVIAAALNYAFPQTVDLIATFIVVLLVVVVFTLLCIYTSQDFQLKVAKMLTLAFSIVMTITTVGLMAQIADDIAKQARNTGELKLSPSTIYLLFMCFLFCATALLHGAEGLNLIHGLWYLLCLPSGYLFLMIYSVANLTDRSWGTREAKSKASNPNQEPWYRILWRHIRDFVRLYCRRRHDDRIVLTDSDLISEAGESISDESTRAASSIGQPMSENEDQCLIDNEEDDVPPRPPKAPKIPSRSTRKHRDGHTGTRKVTFASGNRSKYSRRLPNRFSNGEDESNDVKIEAIPIGEFLHGQYKEYQVNFTNYGYDDTTFLLGMKEQELLDIGIINRGHRKKLLHEIEKLPPEEMDQGVPDDVRGWLIKLGLESYWEKFESNSYTEPNSLADLKFMDKQTIMQTFQIIKEGHLKKLSKAIGYLAYPSSAQRLIRKARIEVDKAPTCPQDLQEAKFWEKLRSVCLLPEQAAFSQSDELKEKLIELRNTGLVMLTVINILWMIIMLTIIAQGNKLHILNTNFLGLLFLSLYTIVLLVQFCTLLWHRVGTWIHLMSRTPFKPGSSINMSWSFHDDELPPEPTDNSLFIAKQRINSRKGRLSRQRRSSPDNSKAFRTIVPPSEEVNW